MSIDELRRGTDLAAAIVASPVCNTTNLGDAQRQSVEAENAFNKQLILMSSATMQMRHLASWRERYGNDPDDKVTALAIKKHLATLLNEDGNTAVAWAAVRNATATLARVTAESVGVCALCGVEALHGICDECEADELPF